MKQRVILGSGVCLALLFLFAEGHVLRARSERYVIESALRRRIQYLCSRMAVGELSASELCAIPLEEIPQLQGHFERIREQDLDWYEKHGWSYLPQVDCRSDRMYFLIGGRTLACDGQSAEFVTADHGDLRHTVTAP